MTANIVPLEIGTLEASHDVSTQAMVFDPAVIAGMQRMAEMMAGAKVTIPKHLAGSPADCLAIIMQAAQWRMNPFAVAQKTHLVNGQLGYEAQLVNSVVQSSGAIRGRFHYEYRGDGSNIECRVGAIPAGESAIVWNEWLSASSVSTRNSPLWKTNPRQQLGYLQVKNWARQYTPGAILGVYSADELDQPIERDMGPAIVEPDPAGAATRTADIKARLAAKRQPVATEPAPSAEGMEAVLADIAAADSLETLAAIADRAAKLTGADKTAARRAWSARKGELTPPPAVDPQTGEIAGELSAFDLCMKGIARADTQADIDEWMTFARDSELAPDEMEQLSAAANSRAQA